ncbi:MAG: hypothetical protein DKM24_04715 [Candidatus Melainabacteria bacterium]|nr:MAG: hypothetical protein DKM24_04715 [Candidatus Melainabacteria bacterium]
MKKLVLILALLIISLPAMAETTIEDLKDSKPHAYRVGTTDDIEIEYKIKDAINTKNVKNADKQTNLEGLTYADLSIKKISREISKELEIDNAEMMGDLSMLWQGAATKSDTIKFAIYKLSNPDADKPNDKSVKKVLSTIASMSTLVGAGSGNPLLATGSFFTGSMLSIMGQDTKAMNYKYSKVNDADMIILVRKIDDLQQNIVNKYYDYMTARQVLKRTTKMVNERHNNYKLAQNGKRELVIIADAYYRDSLDMQMKARNEYFSKRAALEELVGTDVFNQFEQVVNNREK